MNDDPKAVYYEDYIAAVRVLGNVYTELNNGDALNDDLRDKLKELIAKL